MRKIGSVVTKSFGNTVTQGLYAMKSAGFDAFFSSWEDDEIRECANVGEKLGLDYETIHAPFNRMNEMWSEGSAGDDFTGLLVKTVDATADVGVPTVIMHTTIGNVLPPTSSTGMDRFARIIDEAEKKNVRLAFENLEFAEPLGLILHNFKSSNVGFCYDLGHENCYTPGIKYLKMYGDRLFALHIHDNLGIADSMDVSYRDDLHRIPFDGTIDYAAFAKELAETGYTGTLMLEVGNRSDYNYYGGYTLEGFYERAYTAALRLREVTDKLSEDN